MKKWIWLMAPVAVTGLALAFLGGAVFAQEPAKVPPAASGNWTAMADYCRGLMDGTQNTTGMMGSGGMMGGGMMDMMMDMMHGGGMMGAGNMTGHGDMMGGNMTSGGMMGMGGMMGR